ADADLAMSIVRGIVRREPSMDIQRAQIALGDAVPDNLVLAFAADAGRVLISHDRRTMPAHFYRFIANRPSPGIILVPQRLAIARAIEELQLVWTCYDTNEFSNRILYLPI